MTGMRLLFERSGGLLGRKISLTVDLEELPSDQSQILRDLLDKSDFFNLPNSFSPAARPDEFQYKVSVESGDRRHTVETGETSLPAPLRPLISELSLRARTRRA